LTKAVTASLGSIGGGPIVGRFPFLLFSLFFFFFGWPRLSPTLHAPHVAQHEYGGAAKLKKYKK
jgi:hypothetical protein